MTLNLNNTESMQKDYSGAERRRSSRIPARIGVHFPLGNEYKNSEIKDLSMHGFLFSSPGSIPVGSVLIINIDLPKEFSQHPIPVIVKVARTVALSGGNFDIGVETIRVERQDFDKILKYALSQQEA